MSNDQRVAVIAKLPAAAGKRDELVAAFQTAIATAEREDGTLVYYLHADTKDADTLWVYEMYADSGALAAHGGSDDFKKLLGVLGPLMGGAPEMHILAPLGGKGL